VHFRYAIDKGLNFFMEKPVTVDGPTTRRMIALGQEAGRKNLKVGVGLMVRYSRARQQLLNRVRGGQIGDIVAMRGYCIGSGGGVHRRCAPAATTSMLCPSRGSRRRGSLE
jgi:predicted dehydrogenase